MATMTRRRPFESVHGRGLARLSIYAYCTAVLLLSISSMHVESFGIASHSHTVENAIRGKTCLSVSTIAPPPHHMAWLQSQEEREKGLRKQHQVSQRLHKKIEVLPLTMFATQDSLGMANSTAKEAWAASFTTVDALRQTFGKNRNSLWGDLDPSTTRRLYKTLLPRALLELYHCHGASSEDLAPLAYRARVAAKKYARERCQLPFRVGATLFDGFRQFCKYGTFQACGMSYSQLWEKYAAQIMQQQDFENEQDLISKICYKILEKSCETNRKVDNLFLSAVTTQQDLQEVTLRLEQDVYDLVNHKTQDKKKWAIRRYKILRTLLRIRKQMDGSSFTKMDDDLAMQAVLADAAREV